MIKISREWAIELVEKIVWEQGVELLHKELPEKVSLSQLIKTTDINGMALDLIEIRIVIEAYEEACAEQAVEEDSRSATSTVYK